MYIFSQSFLEARKLIAVIICTLFALMPPAAFAFDDDEPNDYRAALSGQVGNDIYQAQVGLGFWNNETDHGQFYISHFRAEDTLKIDDTSIPKQKYTSNRLGIEASSFSKNHAYQGGIFLYSNKSQANIDRVGFGISVALGKMLTNSTRFLIGADLMPEYLSTDWDAKALFEYEAKAILTQKISHSFDVSLNYRYGGVLDSTRIVNYNQATLGLSLKL